ncbi:hypothetical protein RD792_014048 [Penstemon davidsonii]|uniref:Kinesin-like protein n=1 Tax=Penstemon davidsonii TaxID=160366 RepID=A0ABR0CN89_9LAMI|nr:hypothetical protein RD792_014048 [Penstemon davidsonii]
MATQAEFFSTPSKNQYQTSSISRVRVIVRVRPFLPQEITSRNGNPSPCISPMGEEFDEVTVLLKDQESSRNECYKLDGFYGHVDDNVISIYEREVKPLIPGIFQGYNATVFAYGATGSGKTYTMQGSDQLPGLMRLAMTEVLSMCDYTKSTIAVSYYEIYLDKCYDLLEPKEKEVMVWSDKDKEIHLKGLSQFEVNSMLEFHEILSPALRRRKVAHTGLNDVSSRSHGVLVINITTPSHDSAQNVVTGKLNLIDLAGNEDNRRTCNEGLRLQESAKINQSLFVLSNVIYALNNKKPRVPYRESKLTRILQDSLGGTSRALMVACLNPGEYQESVYTVSLAARSRHVSDFASSSHKSSNSKGKVDMEAKLLAWLESSGKTKNAQKSGTLHSQFTGRTPSFINSANKLNKRPFLSEFKAIRNQGVSNSKERTPCIVRGDLFTGRDHANPNAMAQDFASGDPMKENFAFSVGDATKLETVIPDESVIENEETAANKCDNVIGLSPIREKVNSPIREKVNSLQISARKVLSPINSNITKTHSVSPDPKTLSLHSVSFNRENGLQMLGTPLEKFTARSSNLKRGAIGVEDEIMLVILIWLADLFAHSGNRTEDSRVHYRDEGSKPFEICKIVIMKKFV